ncbi:MAG TPA: hypothetical protein VII28_02615, partial [Puia sp.]
MRYFLLILLFSCTKSVQQPPPAPKPHNLLIIENKAGSGVTVFEVWENGLGLMSYGNTLPPGQTLTDSNYSTAKDSYADGSRNLSF